jgi:hypothetical protein
MLKIAKFLYVIMFRLRLYFLWSKLYRLFFQRKYAKIPLESKLSPEEATNRMKLLTWTKDSFKELGDAIGSPKWVQHCINERLAGNPQPKGSLDCDEFGVWAAACLDGKLFPAVLNVFWKGKKFSGHNVCMYLVGTDLYYTGNWGNIGPFTIFKDVILDIVKRGAGPEGQLVGWSLFSPSLSLYMSTTYLPQY